MSSNAKALSLAADIAAELAQRITLTITPGTAADAFPQIVVGTGVASDPGCYIKFRTETWPEAKNILGTAADIFSPALIQVCFEANYASTIDTVADTTLFSDVALILGTLFIRGAKVEVYQSAYGTAPVETELVASKLKATFESSPRHGMIGNQ